MNLNTFFKEKDLENVTFTVDNGDDFHILDTESMIKIVKSTKGTEREKIKNILRKIDFNNGDVNHFLNHLAQGYVKTNF